MSLPTNLRTMIYTLFFFLNQVLRSFSLKVGFKENHVMVTMSPNSEWGVFSNDGAVLSFIFNLMKSYLLYFGQKHTKCIDSQFQL